MADLDALTADAGGMRPVLRAFYADWRGKPITTEQFLSYLATATGLALDDTFERYVYGGTPPRTERSAPAGHLQGSRDVDRVVFDSDP